MSRPLRDLGDLLDASPVAAKTDRAPASTDCLGSPLHALAGSLREYERPKDILVLADAFLEEIGRSVGPSRRRVLKEVREKLAAYAWPGNVRELRNVIQRAVILCEGGQITSQHLPHGMTAKPEAAAAPAAPGAGTLDAAEREMILEARPGAQWATTRSWIHLPVRPSPA